LPPTETIIILVVTCILGRGTTHPIPIKYARIPEIFGAGSNRNYFKSTTKLPTEKHTPNKNQ